jgi:hypothetical protein
LESAKEFILNYLITSLLKLYKQSQTRKVVPAVTECCDASEEHKSLLAFEVVATG